MARSAEYCSVDAITHAADLSGYHRGLRGAKTPNKSSFAESTDRDQFGHIA